MRVSVCLATVAVIIGSGCGSSQSSPVPFAQSDLTGDWHYSALFHNAAVASGTAPGWERGTLRVSDTGAVTAVSSLDSAGGTSLTVPSPWTIDAAGAFTAGSLQSFLGNLNTARTFAVASATPASGGTALWVFQKVVPRTTFGSADVTSKSWRYHEASTGSTQTWEHGDASTDASGWISLTGRASRDGTQPDLDAFAQMSVSADGVVTVSGSDTWSGTLSADKMVMVATHSNGDPGSHEHGLNVSLRYGSPCAQSDLVGRWTVHNLVASANGAAGWSRGVFDVDKNGAMTFQSFLTNAGITTLPAPGVAALDSSGTLTRTTPSSPYFHGQMAASKDFLVRTDTVNTGVTYVSLAFWVK